jgi:phosphoribosylamine--glycine ligase
VLGATAVEATLEEAIDSAYALVKKISFANAYYRNDIGQKALQALK